MLTDFQACEEQLVSEAQDGMRKHVVFESSSLANQQYDAQMLFKVFWVVGWMAKISQPIDLVLSIYLSGWEYWGILDANMKTKRSFNNYAQGGCMFGCCSHIGPSPKM